MRCLPARTTNALIPESKDETHVSQIMRAVALRYLPFTNMAPLGGYLEDWFPLQGTPCLVLG